MSVASPLLAHAAVISVYAFLSLCPALCAVCPGEVGGQIVDVFSGVRDQLVLHLPN